ncbi:hypothetical protein GUF76_22785 [Xanthomonas citri pv. citri]|nr:hypothetical protein [Xanthomonas citri pv. citri]
MRPLQTIQYDRRHMALPSHDLETNSAAAFQPYWHIRLTLGFVGFGKINCLWQQGATFTRIGADPNLEGISFEIPKQIQESFAHSLNSAY